MKSNSQGPDRLKPAGGVRSVVLMPALNVRSVVFDEEGDRWRYVDMADEKQVMECTLVEDRSSFEERLTVEDGLVSVHHTLRLVSDRNFAERWLEKGFVDECRRNGAAAVVTLRDGRMILAGYSRKFETEQPLRIKTLTVRSGEKPVDIPSVELVLESVDTSFAAFRNPK